jgi:flagellar hook-length control protein FliK
VGFSIDFATVLNTVKQDTRSRQTGFTETSGVKPGSFRDSLKEAVNERKIDESKRELVGKAETKLRSSKTELKSRQTDNSTVKEAEENADKKKLKMDEILSMLEELSKLQQMGEIPVVKQVSLLEGIKEALQELALLENSSETASVHGIEAKYPELAAKLEELLKGISKEDGQELKLLIFGETEAPTAVEPEKQYIEASEQNVNAEANKAAAMDKDNKGSMVLQQQAAEQYSASKPVESEAKPGEVSDKASVTRANGDAENTELEEAPEEVKAAVDSKVEKLKKEDRKEQRQEAAPEDGKANEQHAPQLNKAAQPVKLSGEMAAVQQEQLTMDNQVETVQPQIPVQKPETVNKADIINQIVKKAEIAVIDGKHEMRIQLEPENLGKLILKLAVEKGLITAKFVAESQEVKAVIESNFNELKDMLQEKGLDVQNFSVSVGQENKEFNKDNAFFQWKESVRLNSRNQGKGGYEGILQEEALPARIANPYSIHNGSFDHRA